MTKRTGASGIVGRVFEQGPVDRGWLVRDGQVLASLEIPRTRRGKARGLIGRGGIDGAMLLRPARSVHSFGMRFELDVAFVDAEGVVVRTLRLHRHRITPPVWRARSVIEAEAGAFGHWELKIGDVVEVRHSANEHDDTAAPAGPPDAGRAPATDLASRRPPTAGGPPDDGGADGDQLDGSSLSAAGGVGSSRSAPDSASAGAADPARAVDDEAPPA